MENLMTEIMPILQALLIAVFGWLATALIGEIKKSTAKIKVETDSELAQKYIEMISNTIEDCVQATNQTYVEALKKDNAFTKEAQLEAFSKTINAIRYLLSEDCVKYLQTITEDVDAYLTTKIEATVNRQK